VLTVDRTAPAVGRHQVEADDGVAGQAMGPVEDPEAEHTVHRVVVIHTESLAHERGWDLTEVHAVPLCRHRAAKSRHHHLP